MTFTPTQRKIFDMLLDGRPHTKKELHGCLWDDMNGNPDVALAHHISDLRKIIGSQGLDIMARGYNGSQCYCLVRPVTPGE